MKRSTNPHKLAAAKVRQADAAIRAVTQGRTCRECGCTETRPCQGGCAWVESDLCSSCIAHSLAFWIGSRTVLLQLVETLAPSNQPAIIQLCGLLLQQIDEVEETIGAMAAHTEPGGIPGAGFDPPIPEIVAGAFGKGTRTSDTLALGGDS